MAASARHDRQPQRPRIADELAEHRPLMLTVQDLTRLAEMFGHSHPKLVKACPNQNC
jgi:hypothetical protein